MYPGVFVQKKTVQTERGIYYRLKDVHYFCAMCGRMGRRRNEQLARYSRKRLDGSRKGGEITKRIQKRGEPTKMGIVQGSVTYNHRGWVGIVWCTVVWYRNRRTITLVEVLSQPTDTLAVALTPQHRAHVDLANSFISFRCLYKN